MNFSKLEFKFNTRRNVSPYLVMYVVVNETLFYIHHSFIRPKIHSADGLFLNLQNAHPQTHWQILVVLVVTPCRKSFGNEWTLFLALHLVEIINQSKTLG